MLSVLQSVVVMRYLNLCKLRAQTTSEDPFPIAGHTNMLYIHLTFTAVPLYAIIKLFEKKVMKVYSALLLISFTSSFPFLYLFLSHLLDSMI